MPADGGTAVRPPSDSEVRLFSTLSPHPATIQWRTGGWLSEQRVKRLLHRLRGKLAGDVVDERLEAVSADLPFELQSKIFDQLATVSIAGAGLGVTLIGSLLQNASRFVWLSVVFFGLAAITAVGGNNKLIDGLFRRRSVLRRSRVDVQLTMGLIGMAIGILSMTIYAEGKRLPTPSAIAQPKR